MTAKTLKRLTYAFSVTGGSLGAVVTYFAWKYRQPFTVLIGLFWIGEGVWRIRQLRKDKL
jgi:hypothetical protein